MEELQLLSKKLNSYLRIYGISMYFLSFFHISVYRVNDGSFFMKFSDIFPIFSYAEFTK